MMDKNSFSNSPFVQAIAGLTFGGFCMWLALRQVQIDQFKDAIANAEGKWIGLALLCFSLDVASRIFRWKLLLNNIAGLTVRQVAVALICGYMVNNLLPARLGELYRADFIKRRYGISRTMVLGTIFFERLMDATAVSIALIVGLVLAWFLGLSNSPILNMVAIAAISGLLVLAFITIYISQFMSFINRFLPNKLHRFGDDFSSSVATIRSGNIAIPVGQTIIVYLFEFLTLYMILRAVGIDVGITVTLITLGAIVLSTLLPTAPGYIGSMQLAFIVSLRPFDISAHHAFAAATIFQIFIFGSIVCAGIAILSIIHSKQLIKAKYQNGA